MKLSVLLTLATVLVATDAFSLSALWNRPQVEDAARIARTLINRESLANLNSVYQNGEDKGLPVSFVEYYADCTDLGNPVFLAIDKSSSFKNIRDGSPVTLSIRTGDHAFDENVDREYPGSRPNSVAGSPRISLHGSFKTITSEDKESYDKIEKCFLNRHKDAVWWLPGNPIHDSHFVEFEVNDIYFLGGFGDTGFIGKIPIKLYREAEMLDDIDEEGGNMSVERIGHDDIRDWAFEAYMMKHHLLDLSSGVYGKIDEKSQLISSYLNSEQKDEEASLDLNQEEPSVLLDLFRSTFAKRSENEEEASLKVKLVDLSEDQLKSLLEELNSLKTKIANYTAELLNKYGNPPAEKPRYSRHKFNDLNTLHKQDPQRNRFHKDPHHSLENHPYLTTDKNESPFKYDPRLERTMPSDPHHDERKLSGYSDQSPKPTEIDHSSRGQKVQGKLKNYRIIESSSHGSKGHLKPGFYSSHELYKVHHGAEAEVPKWMEDEMIIVVPSDEIQQSGLTNQARN